MKIFSLNLLFGWFVIIYVNLKKKKNIILVRNVNFFSFYYLKPTYISFLLQQ